MSTSYFAERFIQYDPVQPRYKRLALDARTNGRQTRRVSPPAIPYKCPIPITTLHSASQALAEAKQEAVLYGRERRERIRRRVRANEVERDYERRMAEAGARAAAAGVGFSAVPDGGVTDPEVLNDQVIRGMLKP
jgi:hypothetical protein